MRRFNLAPPQGFLGIANSPPVHVRGGASGTWPVWCNVRRFLRCIHGILHVSHIYETLSCRVAVAMANAYPYVKPSLRELFLFLLTTGLNNGELARQPTPCEPHELDSILSSKHGLPQDPPEFTAVIVRRRPGLDLYRDSGSTNRPSRWDSFQNLRVWNVKQIDAGWAVISTNNRKAV